jgi:hypothetical protein
MREPIVLMALIIVTMGVLVSVRCQETYRDGAEFVSHGFAGTGLARQRRGRDAEGKREVGCGTRTDRDLRGERETTRER